MYPIKDTVFCFFFFNLDSFFSLFSFFFFLEYSSNVIAEMNDFLFLKYNH